MQWRLMRGNIIKKTFMSFAFEKSLHIFREEKRKKHVQVLTVYQAPSLKKRRVFVNHLKKSLHTS